MMIIRSHHILFALVIMSSIHILALANFKIEQEIQIEQAKGPPISIVGASAIAKLENDKLNAVDQKEDKDGNRQM